MLQVQAECVCGKKFWPAQAWIHNACATNYASNAATTASNAASNESGLRRVPSGVSESRVNGAQKSSAGLNSADDLSSARPKQRWSREAYNAFQREYMRVWRKNKKISRAAG
jgi:hypothetical protein